MMLPFERYIWAGALAALLALAGIQTVRLAGAHTALATEQRDRATEQQTAERDLAAANQRQREIEAQRTDEQRKAVDEAEQLRAAVASANGLAADAGRRLRDAQSAAVAAIRARAGSGAVSGGAPADATERLLADVQRRLDEATDRIARFADESRIAGRTCERSYDALNPGGL